MVLVLLLEAHGRSKTLFESYRARTRSKSTSVLLYYIQILKQYINKFLYYENQKIIYTEPTLVLTRECQAQVMHHADTPTTLLELPFPYSLGGVKYHLPICGLQKGLSIGSVVLRNHHHHTEIHNLSIKIGMYTHKHVYQHI